VGPRQVGHGPDGAGDRLLANERDGVDADPLPAQVVPVGLADRAQVDLRDLRPGADDDDPLAEDLAQRLARLGAGHAGQVAQHLGRLGAVQVACLEVEDTDDVRLAACGGEGVYRDDLATRLAETQDELDEVGLLAAADADPAQHRPRFRELQVGQLGLAIRMLAWHRRTIVGSSMTELQAPAGRREPGATEPISVAVVGATGYGGGEIVRLLDRHPFVRVAALQARGRQDESIAGSHPHLARTGHRIDDSLPAGVEAVFLALPHGAAAGIVPGLVDQGMAVIDLGPDFRLADPTDYPRWYGFDHPRPDILSQAIYGLPELHRREIAALADERVRIVGAPGCYPTATLLAIAPLARSGLIADVVVDAVSGVSGAGREAKPELSYSEVNENVRAYGVGGHRHVAEMEQEMRRLGMANVQPVDFLPHLVPMTRGILAACHVRPTRPVSQAELDDLYADAYAAEQFVEVVGKPPATKHVLGSNYCRVHVRADERTGRVLAIGVLDNLVKGAAGQAIQAFNILFELPEQTGLEQLPLAP
jgi:N-acetyl-gamma-glutamyl-phosphate reductase